MYRICKMNKFCESCGHPFNNDKANFCSQCGLKRGSVEPLQTKPKLNICCNTPMSDKYHDSKCPLWGENGSEGLCYTRPTRDLTDSNKCINCGRYSGGGTYCNDHEQ